MDFLKSRHGPVAYLAFYGEGFVYFMVGLYSSSLPEPFGLYFLSVGVTAGCYCCLGAYNHKRRICEKNKTVWLPTQYGKVLGTVVCVGLGINGSIGVYFVLMQDSFRFDLINSVVLLMLFGAICGAIGGQAGIIKIGWTKFP